MRLAVAALALLLVGVACSSAALAVDHSHPGAKVYRRHCALCHDQPEQTKSRSFESLQSMMPGLVYYALTDGRMKAVGDQLSDQQRIDVADFILGNNADVPNWQDAAMCGKDRPSVDSGVHASVATFGLGLKNHRNLGAEVAGLDRQDIESLELAWALAFPNITMMRSQPVVVGNTLFMTPVESGELYAFDVSARPCLQWIYKSDRPLRTSLTYGTLPRTGQGVLVFGDSVARAHMVDAKTGEKLWVTDLKHFPQSMMTGTPQLLGDRVFVSLSQFEITIGAQSGHECCKASGAVASLDASSGEIVWYTPMLPPATPQRDRGDGQMIWGPSGAPVWTSPAIDVKRGVLYVGTGESNSEPAHKHTDAIVAVNLEDGAIKWSFQATAQDIYLSGCGRKKTSLNCPPDYSVNRDVDFGASVVIAQGADGRDVLLAGQKSSTVWALDPDKEGAVLWQWQKGVGTPLGGVHWGMAFDGQRIFVPLNDPGSARPGYTPYPGLYALDVNNGRLLWEHRASADCKGRDAMAPRCQWYFGFSGAPVVIGDVVAQGSLDGWLRMFDTRTGEIVFSYDTLREYVGINGVAGRGGALDSAGIVAANGTLYVNSGYGMFGQPAGNVLLAFRPGPRPAL